MLREAQEAAAPRAPGRLPTARAADLGARRSQGRSPAREQPSRGRLMAPPGGCPGQHASRASLLRARAGPAVLPQRDAPRFHGDAVARGRLRGGGLVQTERKARNEYPPQLEIGCFPNSEGMASSRCDAQDDMRISPSASSKKKQPRHLSSEKIDDAGDPGPKSPSSQRPNPEAGKASTSLNVSLGQLPSPRVSRPSLSRRSVKHDTNRRKSLPPLHADVTELSKAISLDLLEKDRLAQLLLSSFQYAAQKFKDSLKHSEGFNPEIFEQKVKEIAEDLRFCTKRLDLDGTLQKCFEGPEGDSSDPALNTSLLRMRENIARLSEEDQAWDRLLQSYQRSAAEISSQLQQYKLKPVPEEPVNYLSTSQAHVLQTKPNYQKILDCQGELFDCMELVLDEIHQAVNVFQTFMEDNTRHLQKLSEQLGSRTFQGLENSPARKLLMLPQGQLSAP